MNIDISSMFKLEQMQETDLLRPKNSPESNGKLKFPSLEFTLGRADWHGAEHD